MRRHERKRGAGTVGFLLVLDTTVPVTSTIVAGKVSKGQVIVDRTVVLGLPRFKTNGDHHLGGDL